MSNMLSNAIVIIAIVVSAGYAVWRLGPRKMRDALRTRFNLGDSSSTKTATPARKEHGVFWRKHPR
jgi:hypothetical protein